MVQCPICAGHASSLLSCPGCDFGACRRCIRTYLIGLSEDACCMRCRLPFTRKTVLSLTSLSFVKGPYSKRREEILFQREIAQMPSTQTAVEARIRERKDAKRMDELRRQIRGMRDEIASIQRRRAENRDLANGTSLVGRCATEGCKGFLLAPKPPLLSDLSFSPWGEEGEEGEEGRGVGLEASLLCKICEERTCPSCHGRWRKGHACEKGEVDTARLLASDSRRCPTCSVVIHRYEGCDQVFCVQCRTAFSYKTGRKVTGPIHNPHYLDLRGRREEGMPRDPADIPCGGRPTAREIVNVACGTMDVQNDIYSSYRLIIHMDDVERNQRYAERRDENVSLRVSYMVGREYGCVVPLIGDKLQPVWVSR